MRRIHKKCHDDNNDDDDNDDDGGGSDDDDNDDKDKNGHGEYCSKDKLV